VNIGHLIASYGYLALFALVAAESLGIPLPGETALITAGIYAGHTHRLSPWLIFAVAAAAAIIGDNIGYWIGDKGGYRLARRYGPKVRLDERKLKIARYLFDRHGAKVVFIGRFVSLLRTYAAFLAGVTLMHWRRFFIANASGGIIWAAIYTFLGYIAGAALERASGTISLITGIIAAILIVTGVILLRRRIEIVRARARERRLRRPSSSPSRPSSSSSPSPANCSSSARNAARSGSVTWVLPRKNSTSQTSSSVGAMFQSPTSAMGAAGSSASQPAAVPRSAASHSSLYA